MTLKQWFIEQQPARLHSHQARLQTLVKIKAPAAITTQTQNKINTIKHEIKTGTLPKIKGLTKHANFEFETALLKTGHGGKKYWSFKAKNGKVVNFYPQAKYGAFISEQKNN